MSEGKDMCDVVFGDKRSKALKVEQASKNKEKKTSQPFSSGTEYGVWQGNNCYQCSKFSEDINKTCKLEAAIALACVTDGQVDNEILDKIGLDEEKCKQFEPLNNK